MVATAISLQLHTPPVIVLLSVMAPPVTTKLVPDIEPATGVEATVTTTVLLAPDKTYEITAVPDETPETTPVEGLTVATDGLPLDHVPPTTAQLKVVALPGQTLKAPVMTPKGLILISFVADATPQTFATV
jgi:hypothetical protein